MISARGPPERKVALAHGLGPGRSDRFVGGVIGTDGESRVCQEPR
jgi:hypothetical protein